jgi:alpha-amylase/alpha-mannosidase (GH57 family)
MTALIIHGHFYQPPRENPWTGVIEKQAGAAPYHDWNERIHAECYGPNAHAHIAGAGDQIAQTVNNYANLSFNFGPTLLSWLQLKHPHTYQKILDADRLSLMKRSGHGNAIAQAYGHAILPLSNERDRETQVLWGLADFRYRFGRAPESLWLPETACDDQTLALLIEAGLRFVILAPNQAGSFRLAGGEWQDVTPGSIDASRPYCFNHPDGSGRSIAIFFYDGPVARAIAFEKALTASKSLVELFVRAANGGLLLNVATDGETYGHHFKFGDLCIAHALEREAPASGLRLTNYGEHLEQHPPTVEVKLAPGEAGKGTSWSCAHGVARWERDCGCHTGGDAGWNQKWRAPLRAALNFLRDAAARDFEALGSDLFADPWQVRNESIQLILDPQRSREAFVASHAKRSLTSRDHWRALMLLDMQRNSLLMFTSCGWFFSEISGIETIQVLRYAARLIDLAQQLGTPLPRKDFLELLAEAQSNRAEFGSGADVYRRFAETGAVALSSVDDAEAKIS